MKFPSRLIPTWLRALLAILIVQLFSACATTNMARTPATAEVKDGEGIVILSITGNTGQVGQIEYVDLLREKVVGKPDATYVLTNVAKGFARDTALFVGIVPAGNYSLSQVRVGVQFLSFGPGARKLVGDIHVDSGSVADLGRIVMTPMNGSVLTGRSKTEASNVELINRFASDHTHILSRPITRGWAQEHTADDLVEELALHNPVGADTPIELDTGEVVAASRMGTLLVRTNEGRWRGVRTGRINSLLAVASIPGGKLDGMDAVAVAVGEFNTIAVFDGRDKLTQLDSGDLPRGNNLAIQGNPHTGWFLAHQEDSKIFLYHSDRLDRGNWKRVRTEDISFSFWNGLNSFWMWKTDTGFAYAVSEGRIERFDFGTSTWNSYQAPNKDRFITIAPTEKTIGVLTSPGGGFGGMFASMYMSYDGGGAWENIKSPYKVKFFAPRTLTDGTLLVAGGGMFAKEELQASSDKGETWKIISTQVGASKNIVVLPSKGLLAIEAGTSFGFASISHSADGGKTWRLEYTNFNRAAYELHQGKQK